MGWTEGWMGPWPTFLKEGVATPIRSPCMSMAASSSNPQGWLGWRVVRGRAGHRTLQANQERCENVGRLRGDIISEGAGGFVGISKTTSFGSIATFGAL